MPISPYSYAKGYNEAIVQSVVLKHTFVENPVKYYRSAVHFEIKSAVWQLIVHFSNQMQFSYLYREIFNFVSIDVTSSVVSISIVCKGAL